MPTLLQTANDLVDAGPYVFADSAY